MAKLLIAVFLLAVLSSYSNAVKLDRCGIVAALREQGFAEENLRDWVCLIEHESDGDTGLKGPKNPNGSYDFGLFQINDKYWCSNTSTPGKGCNVTCADVMTDDITKACACARKIFKARKYKSWYGWKNHCDGKPLPDISKC